MRSKCCFPCYIPPVASLDIRRKASEAAAEIRSDAQKCAVPIHQCKRVADCLRVESSEPEIFEIPAGLRMLPTLSLQQQKIRIVRIIVYTKAAHKLDWFLVQEIISLNFEESKDTFL